MVGVPSSKLIPQTLPKRSTADSGTVFAVLVSLLFIAIVTMVWWAIRRHRRARKIQAEEKAIMASSNVAFCMPSPVRRLSVRQMSSFMQEPPSHLDSRPAKAFGQAFGTSIPSEDVYHVPSPSNSPSGESTSPQPMKRFPKGLVSIRRSLSFHTPKPLPHPPAQQPAEYHSRFDEPSFARDSVPSSSRRPGTAPSRIGSAAPITPALHPFTGNQPKRPGNMRRYSSDSESVYSVASAPRHLHQMFLNFPMPPAPALTEDLLAKRDAAIAAAEKNAYRSSLHGIQDEHSARSPVWRSKQRDVDEGRSLALRGEPRGDHNAMTSTRCNDARDGYETTLLGHRSSPCGDDEVALCSCRCESRHGYGYQGSSTTNQTLSRSPAMADRQFSGILHEGPIRSRDDAVASMSALVLYQRSVQADISRLSDVPCSPPPGALENVALKHTASSLHDQVPVEEGRLEVMHPNLPQSALGLQMGSTATLPKLTPLLEYLAMPWDITNPPEPEPETANLPGQRSQDLELDLCRPWDTMSESSSDLHEEVIDAPRLPSLPSSPFFVDHLDPRVSVYCQSPPRSMHNELTQSRPPYQLPYDDPYYADPNMPLTPPYTAHNSPPHCSRRDSVYIGRNIVRPETPSTSDESSPRLSTPSRERYRTRAQPPPILIVSRRSASSVSESSHRSFASNDNSHRNYSPRDKQQQSYAMRGMAIERPDTPPTSSADSSPRASMLKQDLQRLRLANTVDYHLPAPPRAVSGIATPFPPSPMHKRNISAPGPWEWGRSRPRY